MSLAVGMMREQSVDTARFSYQLNIQQAYARLRGLPLVIPEGKVDTSIAEAGLAYLASGGQEACVPAYLRQCYASIFDPASRCALDHAAVRRFIGDSGGDASAFSVDKSAPLLEDDKKVADALGVWTTPFVVDTETEEVFIGEETLPLAVLRRARQGQSPAPLAPEIEEPLPPPPAAEGARTRLEVWVDVKSPYAFLAIEPTYALEEDFDVELVWRPFLLNIKGFLGSAEVGARDNKVKEGSNKRSPAQWRAVKYAYMNVRRYAEEREPPITVFGTRKIWDTTLAGAAMLFAQEAGRLREFQQHLWPPFWRRELDVEDINVVETVLQAAGVPAAGFRAFASGEGLRRLQALQDEAKRMGIFGVPTYVLDGQRFFGREHLPLLRRRLWDAGRGKGGKPRSELLSSPYLWRRNELFAGY